MRRFCVKIAVGFVASMALAQGAHAGKEVGNGGDPIALEFKQSATLAIQHVRADASAFPKLKRVKLESLIETVQISVLTEPLVVERIKEASPTAPVVVQTLEVVARNFPRLNRIEINRDKWMAIRSQSIRNALALHELLGIVGLEPTGVYSISHFYLKRQGVSCLSDNLCSIDSSFGKRPSEDSIPVWIDSTCVFAAQKVALKDSDDVYVGPNDSYYALSSTKVLNRYLLASTIGGTIEVNLVEGNDDGAQTPIQYIVRTEQYTGKDGETACKATSFDKYFGHQF